MPQAKEQATEAKERSEETKPRLEKGTGTLWKTENGTWMGRVDIGRNAEGKRKYKNRQCGFRQAFMLERTSVPSMMPSGSRQNPQTGRLEWYTVFF